MSTNQPHSPTTQYVRNAYIDHRRSLAAEQGEFPPGIVERMNEFDRWLNQIEAAAEQRGAIKALRDAADYLAENKQIVIDGDEYTACNSCTVIQYDYLTYRADQIEGVDEKH